MKSRQWNPQKAFTFRHKKKEAQGDNLIVFNLNQEYQQIPKFLTSCVYEAGRVKPVSSNILRPPSVIVQNRDANSPWQNLLNFLQHSQTFNKRETST